MGGFRTTGTRNVADVGFTRLDEVTIEAPDGSTATRFVLRMHQAVAVVPLDGDEVVLIEQYRTPFGESLLEIPAGVLDIPGEDPESAVRRELEEEVGYTAGEVKHLIDLIMSPGVTDEVISLYVATGIEAGERRPAGLEEQHARVVSMPLKTALAEVRAGRIRDAKSVVALWLASEA